MSLTPRSNPDLFGHDEAEAALLQAVRGGRLHHGWLITGPPGIGKATLAWRFARFLLAGGAGETLQLDPSHPVFRRVAGGGHADLVAVEPNDKGNLGVDEIRRIEPLFRRSSAEGGWRIAIIDNADAMTEPAQNALLKILEEPPPGALVLLTAQGAGRLLPTIRSRVRVLPLSPLPVGQLATWLPQQLPGLTPEQYEELAALAGGSPGQALALHEAEGVPVYRELIRLLGEIERLPAPALLEYAEKTGRKGGEAAYALIERLFPDYLARLVRLLVVGHIAEYLPGEGENAARLATRLGLERTLALWDNTRDLFRQADRLNLDRKQTLLSALLAVKVAAA